MVLNHSFSVDQTNFLVMLLMVSCFFALWPKSSRLKSKSFTFFGSIVFRFGSHLLALLVKADQTACTGRSNPFKLQLQRDTLQLQHGYMFLPYQPCTCNGRSLFSLSFQVLSKVCGIDPLLTEIFYILL